MADGGVLPLSSARPTVRIAGQESPLLTANVARMRMRETLGGLSSLELGFVDWVSRPNGSAGFGFGDEALLKLGADIKVYAGATLEPQEIFAGLVTAVEAEISRDAPPTFSVLAEDRLFKARKARRSRTFAHASPADLVARIAGDHGLRPEVRDGLGEPVTTWTQMNESDLAFLRRVLTRFDADIQLVGDVLQAGPLARDRRASVELTLGGNLMRARMTADLADQATAVRVGAFDPLQGVDATETAENGESGPGSGRTGPALLAQTLGQVREHVGHEGPMSSAEARALARARFGQRARRFVRMEATAQGDANIRVGSWVTLTGVNPLFANDYAVVEATHRFDSADGYLTELVAECAFLKAPT